MPHEINLRLHTLRETKRNIKLRAPKLERSCDSESARRQLARASCSTWEPKHTERRFPLSAHWFKERNMKTSIATLILLVSAGVGAPALATTSARTNDQEVTHQAVVRYGDIDVKTEHGVHELYRRISLAAHEVCDEDGVPSP